MSDAPKQLPQKKKSLWGDPAITGPIIAVIIFAVIATYGSAIPEPIIFVLMQVGGGLALVSLAYIIKLLPRRQREGETIEQRINRLTNSLTEAIQLINKIEREIESRHALASKLQHDIETYNGIVTLKQSEVEAVAQLLRGELREEGRRSFWQNAALNFVFFVLGAVMTLILIRIF